MSIWEAISSLWSSIITWLVSTFSRIVELFFDQTAGELTFFGVLAISALGISIFFLLVRVIQNFLHFRS